MDNLPKPEKLEIDEFSRHQLAETARWSRFVSIAGFILGGLMIVSGFFVNQVMSGAPQNVLPQEMMKGLLTAVYFLGGMIMVLVSFFLFRFAKQAVTALAFNRNDYLAHSFKNLKMVYKVIGMIIIVYLALSIISMIFTVIGGGR